MAGKHLNTADALSHASVSTPDIMDSEEGKKTEIFVHNSIPTSLPANSDHSEAYHTAQQEDPTCSKLIIFCKRGWPSKSTLSADIPPYWSVQGELTLHNDPLLCCNCIVIPDRLRSETLEKINHGHQGICKCQL